MKKKKNKIKELKEELDVLKGSNSYKEGKLEEAQDALEAYRRKDRDKMEGVYFERDKVMEENRKLMEIIRWLIKPETAKDPFSEIERRKLNN